MSTALFKVKPPFEQSIIKTLLKIEPSLNFKLPANYTTSIASATSDNRLTTENVTQRHYLVLFNLNVGERIVFIFWIVTLLLSRL